MHICVFLSTKKAGRVQLRLPHSSSRAGCPESLNPHLETRKPPAHIFFTQPPAGGQGARRGCGLVKPARAITSSAAIRARIRRPPARAASCRSWASPEPLHARAKILRHMLRLRAEAAEEGGAGVPGERVCCSVHVEPSSAAQCRLNKVCASRERVRDGTGRGLARTVLGGRALYELVLLPGGATAALLPLVLTAVPIAVVIILRRLRNRSRLQSADCAKAL